MTNAAVVLLVGLVTLTGCGESGARDSSASAPDEGVDTFCASFEDLEGLTYQEPTAVLAAVETMTATAPEDIEDAVAVLDTAHHAWGEAMTAEGIELGPAKEQRSPDEIGTIDGMALEHVIKPSEVYEAHKDVRSWADANC